MRQLQKGVGLFNGVALTVSNILWGYRLRKKEGGVY